MMKQLMLIREQLGWQGMTGLSLLAMIGLFHLLVLTPLEDETAYAQHQVALARSSKVRSHEFGSVSKQRELNSFYESMPTEEKVTDILAMISSVAEASRIELKQADYQLDDHNKQSMEYKLTFPVQGEYANIRFFILRVLSDHPFIALDQMNFKRDKVNDAMLKAEIKFTLFIRAPQ